MTGLACTVFAGKTKRASPSDPPLRAALRPIVAAARALQSQRVRRRIPSDARAGLRPPALFLLYGRILTRAGRPLRQSHAAPYRSRYGFGVRVVHEDTVMPDDTVTTSWKRLTDKVKTACGESVHGSLAETSGTALRQRSHADSSGIESDAASSSSPTHAEPAAAGRPRDRNGEAVRQAAGLATWEDEGGTTVLGE